MRIHEVDTRQRRDVNRFINFVFELYKDCEQWVPPLLPDARFQLNREKNSFYKYNDATFFIAEQDGVDVGRICVFEPRTYNEFKGVQNAHFTSFDAVDDQDVANALFDAAVEWAHKRGLNHLRGPLGFRVLDGFGALAEGFEHRPALNIPYNFPYYIPLIENWGFELEERVYSGYVDVVETIKNFPQRVITIAEKVRQRYGFEVVTFDSKREIVEKIAPRLAEVYNRSLTHIAGDPPVTQEEVKDLADSLLLIADPKLLKFIMKDGELVGFMFAFPDVGEGIQRAKGRLFPFGIFQILLSLRRTKWLNFNGMGILPEYQGMGGTALMYAELYNTLADNPRFKHGDVVQISEYNVQSLNEMKKFGIDFYKTHHIYKRDI